MQTSIWGATSFNGRDVNYAGGEITFWTNMLDSFLFYGWLKSEFWDFSQHTDISDVKISITSLKQQFWI